MTHSDASFILIANHIIEVIDFLLTDDADDTTLLDSEHLADCNEVKIDKSHLKTFTMLLISDLPLAESLISYINKAYAKQTYSNEITLEMVSISIDEFIKAPYQTRSTLGCFIHPHCVVDATYNKLDKEFDNNYQTTDDEPLSMINEHSERHLAQNNLESELGGVNPVSAEALLKIAIKLRDLFADQSLIFVPKHIPEYSLTSYGYQAHSLDLIDLTSGMAKAEKSALTKTAFTKTALTKKDSNISVDVPQITCWQFNLFDYKRLPDWLNSKYWANPENFDKYRW